MGAPSELDWEAIEALRTEMRVELIQELIPLGLAEVGRVLDEEVEETLTLHRLGVFPLVGRSLKTTNVLESVNAQAEQRCGRVDRWRNSNHKQRWLAAALIDIEPRLRRLLDYRHLPSLRAAIQKELGIIHPDSQTHAAA